MPQPAGAVIEPLVAERTVETSAIESPRLDIVDNALERLVTIIKNWSDNSLSQFFHGPHIFEPRILLSATCVD